MSTTTSTEFARILAELADSYGRTEDGDRHEHSVYHLAILAGCYSPDSSDSPGTRFLAGIARDVAEYVEPYRTDGDPADVYRARVEELTEDGAHSIADAAVPIYTHERWQTFVDLGAYNEDASELGATTDDLTGAAGVALYMIAERLVRALAEELAEALDADEDDTED